MMLRPLTRCPYRTSLLVLSACAAIRSDYSIQHEGAVGRPALAPYSAAVSNAPVEADPVAGAWRLRCISPDGKPRECVIAIFREQSSLKGRYAPDGEMNDARPAKDVRFDNGILQVAVDGKFAGQTYGLTYSGTPKGDTLQGTVRWSFGWASGTFPFEGERVSAEVGCRDRDERRVE
jgi:hypothetical protein